MFVFVLSYVFASAELFEWLNDKLDLNKINAQHLWLKSIMLVGLYTTWAENQWEE